MKRTTLTIAAGLSALMLSTAAQAASFTFDDGFFPSDSFTFTADDGITDVTVTAGTFPANIFGNPNPSNIDFGARDVDPDTDGLGASVGLGLIADQVDGAGGNDVLVFSFERQVRLESISFTNVDGNDDFAFGTVLGTTFTRVVNFQDVFATVDTADFLGSPAEGKFFGIGAIGTFDNFRVSGLTVSAVPVPAAVPLMATAFGMMGLAGWRRRKDEA